MACINCGWSNVGCPSQWYRYDCSLDNTATVLPAPGYINTLVSDCSGGGSASTYATNYWAGFCNPPTAQYPISTGPYQIDVARGPTTTTTYVDRGIALACRITPIAKCLPYIIIHNAYSMLSGKNTIVEIRKNDTDTNLPIGIPGDNNILGKVSMMFPISQTYYSNPAIPINTILDDIDVPVWVIFYSEDYACSNAFVGVNNRRLQLSTSDTTENNVAIFSETNGCTWAIDPTIKSISLASYKSSTCNGTVITDDFAFAKMAEPPIYLNSNCFVRLSDVQGSKVVIGVTYTNPDPVRTWRRVRFSFAYLKPDTRYYTGTAELLNVSPGQHETFFVMDDNYFTGPYDQLAVSTTVIQV